MAAAAGVPALIVMGPTVASFGFISGNGYRIVKKNLFCRPCGLHGKGKCITGTFECMMSVSPVEVRDAALEILNKGKRV
jgi:heptosyltransferase-2